MNPKIQQIVNLIQRRMKINRKIKFGADKELYFDGIEDILDALAEAFPEELYKLFDIREAVSDAVFAEENENDN